MTARTLAEWDINEKKLAPAEFAALLNRLADAGQLLGVDISFTPQTVRSIAKFIEEHKA